MVDHSCRKAGWGSTAARIVVATPDRPTLDCGVGAFEPIHIVGHVFGLRRKSGADRSNPWASTRPLLQFDKRDYWTIRDAFEGTQIFGSPGSGKTSGSGAAMARSMLAAGFGALVLTVKEDEARTWEGYCADTGRSADFIRLDRSLDHRLNFIAYEATKPGGTTENLVDLIVQVLEARSRGNAGERFWSDSLRTLLRNAVDLLRLADEELSLSTITGVISMAPRDPESIRDPDWLSADPFGRLVSRVRDRVERDPAVAVTAHRTLEYWFVEFLQMPDRTRGSVTAMFSSIADGFLRGELHELFCTETTVRPEDTFDGAVLVLDLPQKVYTELALIAQTAIKLVWQRAVESRSTAGDATRPVFLWADEAQEFVTPQDAVFQRTARSSRAATVYLTQNLPNYVAAFGGDGRSQAESLIGNLGTKIFHANSDVVTNQWAEDTIARDWQTNTSSTQGSGGERRDSSSLTTSRSLDPLVPASTFARLATGGPENRWRVEGIVFKAGRLWKATNANHIRCQFTQEIDR
ncbi:MAG: TraM recognition domain-containing protein [Planctomycetota bacterium]